MAHIQAGTEAHLFGDLGREVRERTIPAVVVVGDADEVGSLALTVFVDVQSVLPKFKKLVGIPSGLQVDGAIRNAAAGRAVQRLSTSPFQSWHMPW